MTYSCADTHVPNTHGTYYMCFFTMRKGEIHLINIH